ncbi:MAG: hypothetical protein AAGJ91_12610 [Pseudomonadota bacterium]
MTSERDLMLPALEALERSLLGELSTGELRRAVRAKITLSSEDTLPLKDRNDQRIDQKVRNLKSHKKTGGNPICEGLMDEIPGGFQITRLGRAVLDKQSAEAQQG